MKPHGHSLRQSATTSDASVFVGAGPGPRLPQCCSRYAQSRAGPAPAGNVRISRSKMSCQLLTGHRGYRKVSFGICVKCLNVNAPGVESRPRSRRRCRAWGARSCRFDPLGGRLQPNRPARRGRIQCAGRYPPGSSRMPCRCCSRRTAWSIRPSAQGSSSID